MSWRVKINIETTKEIGWKLTIVWWTMGIVCYLLWVIQIYAFMGPKDLADWIFILIFPLLFGIFIFYVYVICIFALLERMGKLTKEEKDDSMTLPEIP